MSRFPLLRTLCLLAVSGLAAAGELVAPVAAELVAAVDATGGEIAPAFLRWSASGEPADGGYRMSLSRGVVDIGVRFEPRVAALRPVDARVDSAAPLGTMLPALSVGLRSVAAGPAPASSLVQRALGSDTAVPYVSKVGIEYKPAQSQVFLNQGFGVRLSGDDRVTVRLRKGSLGLYMKRTF